MKTKSISSRKKKNSSKTESLDIDEFDDDGFIDGDFDGGNTIATFSFGAGTDAFAASAKPQPQTAPDHSKTKTSPVPEKQLYKTNPHGLTPPINDEFFTVKRCYQFRPSTIRKLNEIKASHADLNVFLNTILDEAILHYHSLVFNKDKISDEKSS